MCRKFVKNSLESYRSHHKRNYTQVTDHKSLIIGVVDIFQLYCSNSNTLTEPLKSCHCREKEMSETCLMEV